MKDRNLKLTGVILWESFSGALVMDWNIKVALASQRVDGMLAMLSSLDKMIEEMTF